MQLGATVIDYLASNQVFVFGSNATGFHGAGAAGLALRGDHRNNWRKDTWFKKAMRAPEGSRNRVGNWAVFGVSRGFQQGESGKSYAIQTIERPGEKRSTTRKEIYFQLVELWAFIKEHPEWEFLICPLGEGYAGYTKAEMDEVWAFLLKKHGTPFNVNFLRDGSVKDMT